MGADGEEGTVQVAYNNFTGGNQKLQMTCSNRMAVLIQLQVLARLGMRKVTLKDLPQALEQYHDWAIHHEVFGSAAPCHGGV